MSLAAAAAGADGIIVEVHNEPEQAICDGPQALPTERFADYADQVRRVAEVAGKELSDQSGARECEVAVLGVGLIGGSIGLAARERLGAEVVGFDPDRANLERAARARGARRRRRVGRRGRAPSAEVVFCAAPVGALPGRSSPRRSRRAAAEAVVTDVGSTKRELIAGLAADARTPTASSAAIRSPAPRPSGSRTRARSCSRARAGT